MAAAAGALFVAFIMSAQGALGKAGSQFLVDHRAGRSEAAMQWWRRHLVTLVLRGTHRAAVKYYKIHSGHTVTSVRANRESESVPPTYL